MPWHFFGLAIIVLKVCHYSVFRRSIPQNFEEYVVTAPRWTASICRERKKRRRTPCSAHKIFSSWSIYNIFFKILRYTSSENTVARVLKWGNYLPTVTVRWHHMFSMTSHATDFPWPGGGEKLVTYILNKQNKQARLLYVRSKFCE